MPPVTEPTQLLPLFRERVWGREKLAMHFDKAPRNLRIGEVWFTFEENQTSLGGTLGQLITAHPEVLGTGGDPQHPGICPLLTKFLFTTQRLSVQVHPDDDYAERHHQSLGKTEAWYVLDAEPAAELAVGFREPLSRQRVESAAKSGEIERLLDWRKVEAGNVIFVPSGTVHAIGAGLTIFEVQENSDITYRLYDYGRPRELHLEHGVEVSQLGPHQSPARTRFLSPGREELVSCPYFRMERLRPQNSIVIAAGQPCYMLLTCSKGTGVIRGAEFKAGQCWMVPAGNDEIRIEGPDTEWIATYRAEQPAAGVSVG
ncbi:MAG: class I mannose-6-phosphate isomerase [Acidobacteriaceae bacterium]|nr:class I mannose-6-phosphate isomerase [Acidobacteriaceae bacterium]MBV9502504.1 class I mannose-6-phosphate isomerase [Acidobacteriaceae bacterium]